LTVDPEAKMPQEAILSPGEAVETVRRELGHLHRTIADLPFPRRIRDDLVERGRARPHHVLPESGWVTAPMRTPSEVANVIDLFRQNYDRRAAPVNESKR
jgi:hypothetical protein